jgi:chromosome segregation ATPase
MNIGSMSEIAEIVDTLEKRLGKVISKLEDLEKTNLNLRAELNKTSTVVTTQNKDFEALKMECDTLKIANSLLGSEENKRDTKLKINSLIREIDYCIAQLSD